jgi:ABC-type nickel/cobalt efflux system permease component RcnA
MPLIAEAVYVDPPTFGRRLILATVVIFCAGVLLYLASLIIGYRVLLQQQPQSPFSIGLRETVLPGMVGSFILDVQAHFYSWLVHSLRAVRQDRAASWPLLLLGFAYGLFHAAGPGHGKAVIGAYLLADRTTVATGVALSIASAIVQGLVAIGIVGILAVVLHMSALQINKWSHSLEETTFALMALFGLWLTWLKVARLNARRPGTEGNLRCQQCSHFHLVNSKENYGGFGGMLITILAAGIRPCSGAIMLLAFALSQEMFPLGATAVFAMSLGTAVTTAAFATAAVAARHLTPRSTARRGRVAIIFLNILEVTPGAFVFWFGVALFLFG